jgi:BirA family transcriptional regulator, biotin operon repressor / biotin---[acetyl-CoA-carboxylase] ligase
MAELTERAIREALAAAGVPEAPVRYDAVTGSTNTTALELARAGTPEWTLVAAGRQTAGRGRLGRTWVSPPGVALHVSVVLRPEMPPDRAVLLTLLAGTSMARGCVAVGEPEVMCKWPNDLVRIEEKVGGILAEAAVARGRIDHVVLGVGMNLGSPPPDVPGAGALPGVDPADLLTAFLAELSRGYQAGPEPWFARRVLDDYRPLCATLGRRVRSTTTDGRVVEGTAVDLGEDGSLVIDTRDGRATVGFGEVEHLR